MPDHPGSVTLVWWSKGSFRDAAGVPIDIDEAPEDLDHLITPEERLRVGTARQ
jgi:hypothetical protein